MPDNINSPEQQNNVLLLNFKPKYNPNTRVSVYQNRKKRNGYIVDCLGLWGVTVTPNGIIMQSTPPDEKSTMYAVTFVGNANVVEWIPSNLITEIE